MLANKNLFGSGHAARLDCASFGVLCQAGACARLQQEGLALPLVTGQFGCALKLRTCFLVAPDFFNKSVRALGKFTAISPAQARDGRMLAAA